MCTVTLSYDGNNAQAREQLAALLATGLFSEEQLVNDYDAMDIDQLDTRDLNEADAELLKDFMQGAKQRIPNKNMSLEEAHDVVMGELRLLNKQMNAVRV